MNKKTSAFVNSVVLISLALGGISAAEAQRLGGGTSFGSKQSYSAPMQRSALPPSSRTAAPPASHPAPAQNHQQPQQQPANSNQAWKDRAMGAAAGLAVGGLVGSMVGGNSEHAQPQQQQNQGYAPQQAAPQQGYAQPAPMQNNQQGYADPNQGYAQPAPMQNNQQGYAQPAPVYRDNNGATKSGGIGWLGYLLLGGLGYLAYRFFFAKKTPTAPTQTPNYQRTSNEPAYSAPMPSGGSSADFNTDIMFKKADSTVSSS
ncbi:MAG: hypothetical protein WCI06_05745, partial [Methylococcaceae bacterium]